MPVRNPFWLRIVALTVMAVAAFAVGAAVPALESPAAPEARTARIFTQAATLTGIGALLLALVFLVAGQSYARHIRDILAGDYWVHWRYDASNWQQVARAARSFVLGGYSTLAILIHGLGLPALIILMASAYDGSSPILLDITLLFGLFALVVFIQVVTRPRRYHRLDDQLDDQQVEAYIGLGGIYFAGV